MTRRLFTEIAGVYDRMNHLLSLGLDKSWRRRAARTVDGDPSKILDLACGTGDFAFALARAFPAAAILGLDLTPAMLEVAREKNAFPQISFAEANAEKLLDPSLGLRPSAFSLVSCAFGFRNFQDKRTALRNVRQLLAPHGQLLVLEFFRPANAFCGAFTSRWLRLLTQLFAARRKAAYGYLNLSMRQTLSEREFFALAEAEGFILQKRRFYFPCCSCLLFGLSARSS